jgi:outer membrane protein OmpA-like peptidoglycan-associated protein
MNYSRLFLIACLIPVALALATSGCATKKFVSKQLAPINSKISALETKTNDQADREATDVSRLDEKLGSTDSKVAEVASAAQQANTSAAQANQLAQQNQSAIAVSQSAIAANADAIATLDKAMTYSLAAKGEITFAFNQSKLDKTDEAALDILVQQVQSSPRVVFELIGFTDRVGTREYNLALSRRRAESVERYLVRQGVALRGIHIVGLGKEPVPSGLLAEFQAVDPNATAGEARRLARRVLIRIYAPNASVPSSESASLKQ